jgi:hypothetical protein
MPTSTDNAEMDAVLSLLARESSDSALAEPMAITDRQELGEVVKAWKPKGAQPKRPCRVSRPTAPVEEKRKKRRLRRLSSLDQGVGPSAPVLDETPAEALPKVDAKGRDCAPATAFIFHEDEEEEEEEVLLIQKNSRHYRGSEGGSDIPSLALLALVSLQGLSISDFDQALEDVVPEDMLSEPTTDDVMAVSSEIPGDGLGVSQAVSCASSTLEGSLRRQDAGPSHLEST